jgi:hypothetical protein
MSEKQSPKIMTEEMEEKGRSKLLERGWKGFVATVLLGWKGVAAFSAAMLPAAVALHGFFVKQTELELASIKQKNDIDLATARQENEIKLQYLDRAIDPMKSLKS